VESLASPAEAPEDQGSVEPPAAAAAPAEASPEPGTPAEGEVALEAPAEPVLVEVWRPARAARPEGPRRPRFRRRDEGRSASRPAPHAEGGATATAQAANETQGDTAARPQDRAHQRHHRRHGGPDQRFDRPPRDREPQRDRGGAKPPRFERREKQPDPNSPFAKLAALKAQLEAEAKERR
jgi:ATP-dependent RNA helicase SUPV3L1/SUV3